MTYWIDLKVNRSVDNELHIRQQAAFLSKGLAPENSVR
jgi:hypothetical protein